ncbi:MAG: hypothetical protein WC822_05315 [Candidatus Paceibacterota bacterium]|jgi:hypothetical protein
MKYRVRLDLAFDLKEDADKVVDLAKTLIAKSSNINETKENKEISTINYEQCLHDEGGSCVPIETVTKAIK